MATKLDNTNSLLARFRFVHVEGAELGYYYEKELVDNLGFARPKYDEGESFLEVGQKIQLVNKTLTVSGISVKLHDSTIGIPTHGFNGYGIGEQLPYNLDIIVFCK